MGRRIIGIIDEEWGVTMSFHKKGETVLITGASEGIGYGLGRLFAMNGYDLVLVDSEPSQLRKIADEWKKQYQNSITCISENLSGTYAAENIYSELERNHLRIDILINHASFDLYGSFMETDLFAEMEMIQVHIRTMTSLTKLIVRDMAARRKGRVLNVASTVAFQPRPTMTVFHATNAFILAFSEALSNEMKEYGIRVSTVCAGPSLAKTHWKTKGETGKIFSEVPMSPQNIAEISFREFMDDKPVIIPGMKNRILARSVRLLPRKIVTRVVKKMDEDRSSHS